MEKLIQRMELIIAGSNTVSTKTVLTMLNKIKEEIKHQNNINLTEKQKRHIGNILFHQYSWNQKEIDDLDLKLIDIIEAYQETKNLYK